MGKYFQTGKQVLFVNNVGELPVHIADAQDEEKSRLIVKTLNERSTQFVPQALVTLSPLFHGDMVADEEFRSVVNGSIEMLNHLDKIKKSLFYGRDNNLISEGQNDVSDLPSNFGGNESATVRELAIDIIHAILGIATEAGELLELLRDTYNGKAFDWTNLKEELGDIFWYFAPLANHGDFTFEEIQTLIIAKLRKRYADKFSAHDAINRDLNAERSILEGDKQLTEALGDPLFRGEADATMLTASNPASGPDAVKEAAAKSAAAFERVKAVEAQAVDAGSVMSPNSDMSKPIGERMANMPGENLARQPIRKSDVQKK